MPWLWLYVGGLLLAVVVINVLALRTIRAERRRSRERPSRPAEQNDVP